MNVIPIRRTKKLCNRFSSFNVNQTEKRTIGGFIGGPKATNHTKVANDEVVVSSCHSDNIPSSLSNCCTVVKQPSETAD